MDENPEVVIAALAEDFLPILVSHEVPEVMPNGLSRADVAVLLGRNVMTLVYGTYYDPYQPATPNV
jgi:hypothetical protein